MPKQVLRVGISLLGSFAIPHNCLSMVLLHAPAFAISHPKVDLCRRIPLICRLTIPTYGLIKVLGHPIPEFAHHAEFGLSLCIALLPRLLIPECHLPEVQRRVLGTLRQVQR